MNQVQTQGVSRNGVQLQAHEVTGVERIIGPCLIAVFAAVHQRLHFVGTALHNLKLLFLLFRKFRRLERIEHKGL
ncbi:hypothetical protein D3C81_2243540 [compost metagenome]